MASAEQNGCMKMSHSVIVATITLAATVVSPASAAEPWAVPSDPSAYLVQQRVAETASLSSELRKWMCERLRLACP